METGPARGSETVCRMEPTAAQRAALDKITAEIAAAAGPARHPHRPRLRLRQAELPLPRRPAPAARPLRRMDPQDRRQDRHQAAAPNVRTSRQICTSETYFLAPGGSRTGAVERVTRSTNATHHRRWRLHGVIFPARRPFRASRRPETTAADRLHPVPATGSRGRRPGASPEGFSSLAGPARPWPLLHGHRQP